MKTIPVEHDTRSEQKFTKKKLQTMRPGDIAAVAAQRGYAVDTATRRISHDSFLKQQEESSQYAGNEGHTESGEVPDDFPYDVPGSPTVVGTAPSTPSVQGSVGGLPPAEIAESEPSGERSSAEKHTGVEEGSFTLGAEKKS